MNLEQNLFDLVTGAPVVPAHIENGEWIIIPRCPKCGERHTHKRKKSEHPKLMVFRRRAHCADLLSLDDAGYFLTIEGDL